MSKEYREILIDVKGFKETPITDPNMRLHCQRPGDLDEDGNPIYFTEQSHAQECDINTIIQKYDKFGLINHVNNIEAQYGDVSGIDYRSALDLTMKVGKEFSEMPSKIRNYFDNDPGSYLEFMENPDNREKAIELGLIHQSIPPELDGLGEWVKKPPKANSTETKVVQAE